MTFELINTVPSVPLLLVLVVGGAAAVTDLRSFKIPNYITLPLLAAGLVYHAFFPSGQGLAFAIAGMAAGFACLILFYVLGGVGAGDVKLLAAMGASIGPVAIFAVFLVAALLMGLYSVGMAFCEGRLRQNFIKATLIVQQGAAIIKHLGPEERVEEVITSPDRRKHLIPFAVMVLGGIAFLLIVRFVVP